MKKRQRLYYIVLVLAALAVAAGLSLYALKDNVSFFYSPMEAKKMNLESGYRFRLGGLVASPILGAEGNMEFFVLLKGVK